MAAPGNHKGPNVADLRTGDRVTGFYLVRRKQLEPFRDPSKGEFLTLTLADRTGEILGRVWEDAPRLAETFSEGDVIKVAGDVSEYQGRPQLVVQRLRRAEEHEYDLRDFQQTTTQDVDALLEQVRSAVKRVQDPHLAALIQHFYNAPSFVNQLIRAPAARRVHHAYVGGLLEHLTEMLAVADTVVELYPDINADLLYSGVLLHIVGKLAEYTWARDITQTDEGRLLGHVVLSDEQVSAAMAQIPDFPQDLSLRLRHMLISQHGRREWGSPRQPATLEAIALHHIENLTAQISRFRALLAGPRESGQAWTEYNRLLGRQLYVGTSPPSDDEDDGLPLE